MTGPQKASAAPFPPGQKLAGVLVPVFSLRGAQDAGIGDTAALREFLLWAASRDIGAVQVLPVNEPGADHSPYNLMSAMALDPLTIATTPDDLPGMTAEDYAALPKPVSGDARCVDYPAVEKFNRQALEAAHARFLEWPATHALRKEFDGFLQIHADWLNPYLLHRTLLEWNHKENPAEWPEAHHSPAATNAWLDVQPQTTREHFKQRSAFFGYIQWVAWRQWCGVRELADRLGIALIGDIPVGVSLFSADVWSHPEWFDTSRSSGAPPERVFQSEEFTMRWGQNWGFPLYNWKLMEADNFHWWRQRLRSMLGIFHLLRVDHALGFFRIYSFPWRPEENARFTALSDKEASALTGGRLPRFVECDDDTPQRREHNRKHGERIFRMFLEETGPARLIAEDLGEVAPYVRPTLAQLEIPGCKIPQWERSGDRLTPGVAYPRLSLTTFATHDHPPLRALWSELYQSTQAGGEAARRALHQQWEFMDFCARPDFPLPAPFSQDVHHAFLRGLLLSNSWLAIHMISDILGNDDRFNVPGSIGQANWTRRLPCPTSELNVRYADSLAFLQQAIHETGRHLPK